MPTLQELTQQLAEGTRRQKQRSWRSLIQETGLWSVCQAVFYEPDPLGRLTEAYRHLDGGWDRSPLHPEDLESARRVEEQLATAQRLVAAAALTAAARSAKSPSLLTYWAMRAAGGTSTMPALPPEALAAEPGEGCIRACFRALHAAQAQPPAALAAAQDASLSFLWAWLGESTRPSCHRVRIPLLLAKGADGYLAWLWLERMRCGFGQLFQAPETLLAPVLPDLRSVVEAAHTHVRTRVAENEDVRWWLTDVPAGASGQPLPVGGTSAAAAAALGLTLLLRGGSVRARCAITATVSPDGRLGAVQGLQGNSPKLSAARALAGPNGGGVTVIVSPESQLTGTAATGWEAQGVRVVPARSLDEAERLFAADGEVSTAGPQNPLVPTTAQQRPRVALLYVRHSQPDRRLRELLERELQSQGFQVDTDRGSAEGVAWARETEHRIQTADLVVILLTAAAADSEILTYEVQLAHEAAQSRGMPRLVVVRAGDVELPEILAQQGYPSVTLDWTGTEVTVPVSSLTTALRVPVAPSPQLEPELLVPPTGVLPLDSDFYLRRSADREFRAALLRRDSIIRVKGARQMGKTSLLARGLDLARQNGATVVLTDFQLLNQSHLTSVDVFLHTLARHIIRQVPTKVSLEDVWDPLLGASVNFRDVLLEVLNKLPGPVVWGLDEVDRLFFCDFRGEVFGLIRSLHNERALNPALPWSRLTLVLCYATEASLFLTDLNQSPFNVGTRLMLDDFSLVEIAELNRRYGSPLRGNAELTVYYDLLEGNPYLSHRGLHEMASGKISLAELRRRAAREDGLFGDHLRRLLLLLTRNPELSAAVSAVLRGRVCPSVECFHRLWTAGILVGDSLREARLRCRLYAEYLERHLP